MTRIAVILLAAGRSTRFSPTGAHKLLAPIRGIPVVRLSAQAAVDAGVGDVVVVTGAEATAIVAALGQLPVRAVHADDFASGMSASVRRGVEAIRANVQAVMIALADQPMMRAEYYRTVVATWRTTGAPIVTPMYASSTGPAHPTLFAATVFDELVDVRGDTGARSVIARDPTRVAVLPIDAPVPRDIDTPEDLAEVEAALVAQEITGESR